MYVIYLWIIYDYILFKIFEVLVIFYNIFYVMISYKIFGLILLKLKIKFLFLITWILLKF